MKMLNRENMREILRKYLTNKYTRKELGEIVRIYNDPDEDPQLTEQLQEYWNNIPRDSVEKDLNDEILDKVHHKIALEESRKHHTKIRSMILPTLRDQFMKVAAILILPLMIATVYLSYKQFGQYETITTYTAEATMGVRTNFILPDGSKVWLNAGTVLEYPNAFDGKSRTVRLNGEAFFEVEKRGKPFVVETDKLNVRVLGTKFNVSAYGDDDDVRVTLVSGAVRVEDGSKSRQLADLKPQQQLRMDKPTGKLKLLKVDTDYYTSWKDGRLEFYRVPLDVIAKKLERWYNVKIIITDKDLEKTWFNATIEHESFSEVLELMKATTPMEYSFDKKTRVITITKIKK